MKTVKIVNYLQAAMYIKHGVKPIDMDYTNKIVFIFDAENTKEVWEKWKRKELN